MKKSFILLSLATILFAFSSCTKEVEPDGEINGYEYVDLGLSVKWATCNVGASSPEEYGDYFAWGETSPKDFYTREPILPYEPNPITGTTNSIAGTQYDAARANWGGSWRMPTEYEIERLFCDCVIKWTTQNGVQGCRFTSKANGKSIFLPAAGYREGSSLYSAGESGTYLSDLIVQVGWGICSLHIDSDGANPAWWSIFGLGFSIRPVTE